MAGLDDFAKSITVEGTSIVIKRPVKETRPAYRSTYKVKEKIVPVRSARWVDMYLDTNTMMEGEIRQGGLQHVDGEIAITISIPSLILMADKAARSAGGTCKVGPVKVKFTGSKSFEFTGKVVSR